jgi:lambda repressor-like predicted transcriptional regulator
MTRQLLVWLAQEHAAGVSTPRLAKRCGMDSKTVRSALLRA